MVKTIKIRLKNFLTKNQKSILVDTLEILFINLNMYDWNLYICNNFFI